MYEIDSRDRLVELDEFPKWDTGAPAPVVIATDSDLYLTYIIADNETRWKDAIIPQLPDEEYVERWATVRFHRVHSHMLGVPNDEALVGHPLWERGSDISGSTESKGLPGRERLSGSTPSTISTTNILCGAPHNMFVVLIVDALRTIHRLVNNHMDPDYRNE